MSSSDINLQQIFKDEAAQAIADDMDRKFLAMGREYGIGYSSGEPHVDDLPFIEDDRCLQ